MIHRNPNTTIYGPNMAEEESEVEGLYASGFGLDNRHLERTTLEFQPVLPDILIFFPKGA